MAKFLNSNDPDFVKFLQECELPNPRFYLKRDSLKEKDFNDMAAGTTWDVLSDPVGDVEPKRKFVFCKCNKCGFRRNVRFADLKSNSTACENCLQNKLNKEANYAGCDLIGKSEINTQYRKYKIRDCGHILDIRTESVRLNLFKCKQCLVDSIFKACEGTSFIPLIDGAISYRFKAKCSKCGIVHNKSVTLVGKCKNCIEIKEKENALVHGAVWLKRLNGTLRLYKLNCGHDIISSATKVSNGTFECKQCIKENLEYCAGLSGASIVKTVTSEGKCLCKLSCGCVTKVRRDAIYRGRIYCKNHDKTHYNNPNGVYLIEINHDGFSWLKLGMSLDLDRRISEYKLHEDSSYSVLKYIKFKTGHTAIKFENSVHKIFDKFNLDNNLMKNYMKSGFSECYPTDKKADILQLLEEKEKNAGHW